MRSKNNLVNIKPNKESGGKPERPRSQPKMNPRLRTQSRKFSKSIQRTHQNPSDPQAQQQQQTKMAALYEKYRKHFDTLWWAKQNQINEAGINLEDQLSLMLMYYRELRLQLRLKIEEKRQWLQKSKQNEAKRRQLEQELNWAKRQQQKTEQSSHQASQAYFNAIKNEDLFAEELKFYKDECEKKYERYQLKISKLKDEINKMREEETRTEKQRYSRDFNHELLKLDQQGLIISSIQDFVENNSGLLLKKIRARKDQLTKLNAQYKRVEHYLKCSQQKEWPADQVERLKASKKDLTAEINQKETELSTLDSKIKKDK